MNKGIKAVLAAVAIVAGAAAAKAETEKIVDIKNKLENLKHATYY